MELEQLKTVWEKTTESEMEGYFVNKKEVQQLIAKRSNTTISQIKRKIRNKVLIAGSIGLLLLAFTSYLFTAEDRVFDFIISFSNLGSNIEVGILYLALGLVICFISLFNAFSYRKILGIEKKQSDLKSSIQNILAILHNAIKLKIYTDCFVVPTSILVVIIIDVIQGIRIFPNTTVLLLFILGAIAFAVLSYFISSYDQNKRYGSQILVLKECLKELNEER